MPVNANIPILDPSCIVAKDLYESMASFYNELVVQKMQSLKSKVQNLQQKLKVVKQVEEVKKAIEKQ